MLGSHWLWLLILFFVVLIVFGPGRLPELGGAVGKAMREFRKATSDINEVTMATPAQSSASSAGSAVKGSTSEANPRQS
jgi:sec-independent protein translocase protein TatA